MMVYFKLILNWLVFKQNFSNIFGSRLELTVKVLNLHSQFKRQANARCTEDASGARGEQDSREREGTRKEAISAEQLN